MVKTFQSLLDGQTTGTSVNHENDIIMQALQEAEITPLHDLEELKRELAEEQAKNKQLSGHLKNQYSKISRLRKTYQDHLQAAENEHFRSARANQQHLEEKKKLQENVLALTGQVEVYKRELEASKSEAQHHEKLLRERDRAFQALKAELKTIQAKLKGLINERIFVFCEWCLIRNEKCLKIKSHFLQMDLLFVFSKQIRQNKN